MDRLEIAKLIKSKVTLPDTDIVSELVAKGEIELGYNCHTVKKRIVSRGRAKRYRMNTQSSLKPFLLQFNNFHLYAKTR